MEDIWNEADLLTIEPRTSQKHLKSLSYLKLIWLLHILASLLYNVIIFFRLSYLFIILYFISHNLICM